MNSLIAWFIIGLFLTVFVYTIGQPKWITEDQRIKACFKRGMSKLFGWSVIFGLFGLVVLAITTVLT